MWVGFLDTPSNGRALLSAELGNFGVSRDLHGYLEDLI